MAITNYTYTKAINLETLRNEINESSIATALHQIKVDNDDDLTVSFVDAISGGDETTLDGIVSSHTNVETPTIEGFTIFSNSFGGSDGTPLRAKSTAFKRLRSFAYLGNDFWGKEPVEVKLGVFIDDNSETGTIRLYDLTNDVVLGSATTTSEAEEIVEMTCTGWPASEATIEIQIKSTKHQVYAYCTSITILG